MSTIRFHALRLVGGIAATAVMTLSAHSQTIGCTTGGPGGLIPTSGSGGGGVYQTTLPPSQLDLPLAAIPPAGSTCVTEVKLHGLSHTWIGDVQFVLTDPNGARHNLFCRAGYFSCDFGGDYTIVGQCQGLSLPSACSGTTVMAPGTYDQVFNDWISGSSGINNTPLNAIPALSGTWILTAYDWAGGDTGMLTSWDLCFGTPPPSTPPTGTPLLLTPADQACATPPITLTWSDVTCATTYDVDVDGTVTTGVAGASLVVSPANGIHQWRVRGTSGSGAGPWSNPQSFFVGLTAPASVCIPGGLGGGWPISGTDGVWPTVLPTGQLDSPLAVSVPPGSNKIVALVLRGFTTTWVGDQHFVLEDPNGGMHNIFYRPGSVNDSFGLSCDAGGGDYTIVDGCYTTNNTLACDSSGLNFLPGSYTQNFGDWPTGSAGINNTAMNSIPVLSGTYTLHCYDWYVGADDASITSWELCFETPQGPVSYCTPSAPGTTNGCVPTIAGNNNPNTTHSNSCVVTVSNVEGQKAGIIFYGVNGPNNTPWCSGGNSFLCVKAPTQRTSSQNSGGSIGACNGTLTLDWNAYQLANPTALGNPWMVGSKAWAQGWFRDPPACKTTFLSEALELTYQ